MSASDATVTEVRRARDALFRRVTWWEAHRYTALVPVAMGFFGVGYGLGWVLHQLADTTLQVGYYLGIASLIAGGRTVDRMFSPTRIAVLDARIQRLERSGAL